ncbi:MAG: helix-turn-helix transcriptional regulator [Nitrososphaeraceae archaeon]
MPPKLSTSEFINKANKIHDQKFNYTKVDYINNKTKVIIICPIHGEFQQLPTSHLSGRGCWPCSTVNKKDTTIKKYGVDHPLKNASIKKKKEAKCIEKYGTSNPSQHKDIKLKRKQTMLTKYGVEYPYQSKELRDKRSLTMLTKYGVEYPYQSKELWDKRTLTMLTKYGVEHARQSEYLKERTVNTTLRRYGVENYNQQHMVDILPLINNHDWLFDQYIIQNKTTEQIANELNIGSKTVQNYLRRNEIAIKYNYNYSYNCITWLDQIMNEKGIYIQHAANIGEFKIPGTRYKADGYCSERNTIYEFHGDYWHGNPNVYSSEEINVVNGKTMGELYKTTVHKEQIIRKLGYNLIVMWEKDWDYYKSRVKNISE